MSRRGKTTHEAPHSAHRRGAEDGFGRVYEGEATLRKLLASCGAQMGVADVVEMLKTGLDAEMQPDEVFPELFDEEPRFTSPADARRLYANLFGLWDRLAAGRSVEPTGRPVGTGREAAPPPEPMEPPLSPEFVEAAWKHLADLPPKDMERWLHKWANIQPELTEALQLESGEDAEVADTADTLAFEVWVMLELAQHTRIRPVRMEEFLGQLRSKTAPEPALDRYIEDALEEARLDEEQPLSDEQSAKVGSLVRAAVRALAQAR